MYRINTPESCLDASSHKIRIMSSPSLPDSEKNGDIELHNVERQEEEAIVGYELENVQTSKTVNEVCSVLTCT